MEQRDLSYEDVSLLAKERGRKISAAYLRQLTCANRHPKYALAKFLSNEITGGAVTIAEFMEWRRGEDEAA